MPGWSLDLNRLREMRGPGESYSDMIHNWRRRTPGPQKTRACSRGGASAAMRSRQMNEGRQTDECHRRRIVPPDERPSHKKAPRKRENRGAKMACQEGTKMATPKSLSEKIRIDEKFRGD